MGGKRRIDRILDDGYLDGLEDRSTPEIREMRDECQEEESGVSYARRVLQGRMDIVRAELLRRDDQDEPDARPLLERLPSILAEGGQHTAPAQARATRFLVPPSVEHERRASDRVAEEESYADLPQRSLDELEELVGRLAAAESELSATRRQLFDRIDRLQQELIDRYRSGAADVRDLLTESG